MKTKQEAGNKKEKQVFSVKIRENSKKEQKVENNKIKVIKKEMGSKEKESNSCPEN